MKYHNITFILIALFSIQFISAAGLELVNSTVSINKAVGTDYFVNLTLKNTQTFHMYNISFEDNPYITIAKISQLGAGQNISVQARVFNDASFTRSLRIRGFYNSTVGPARLEYPFDITKDVLSQCYSSTNFRTFNLVEGDTIKLTNKQPGEALKMFNSGGTLISSLDSQATYMLSSTALDADIIYRLEYPSHISSISGYYCYFSFRYSDDTGLVNRQEYDAVLNLNSNVVYDPTNLTVSFIETNYTTNFYTPQEGLFSIKNSGNKPAPNVMLSGNWMTFSANNFSLDIGQTKTVSYTIKPVITNTSETNKTYLKIMYINGNFQEIRQDFYISIPFAEISGNYSSSNQGLIEFITEYCRANPTICNTEARIVYMNVNNSDNLFNATLGEKQLKDLFVTVLDSMKKQDELATFYKESLNNITVANAQTDNKTAVALDDVAELKEDYSNLIAIFEFLVITVVTIIFCVIMYFIVRHYQNKNTIEGVERT